MARDAIENLKYYVQFPYYSLNKQVAAVADSLTPGASPVRSSGESDSEGWYRTSNINDAIEKAQLGWKEGTEYVSKMRKRLNREVRHLENLAQLVTKDEWGVSGMWCDVGAYLGGDPECMVSMVEELENPTSVTIYANACGSGGTSSEHYMRRGAVTCALIDILETAGIRCELVACAKNTERLTERDPSWGHITATIVKRTHDPLDMDRLAFALCNPSWQRRLVFRMREVVKPTCRYGSSLSVTQGDLHEPDNCICIEVRRHGHDDVWSSDERALQWLRDQVKAYLPAL